MGRHKQCVCDTTRAIVSRKSQPEPSSFRSHCRGSRVCVLHESESEIDKLQTISNNPSLILLPNKPEIMSTSAYYNFITNDAHKARTGNGLHSIETVHHRRDGLSSPASFETSSSSNSSSSLYQFSSLTPTSVASSASSSASSTSSSASSSASRLQVSAANSNAKYQNHRDDLLRQSSLTQANQSHHQHASQLFHSYTLHSLQPKPLKPFKTSSDYLEAMKEDLAEWLNRLYTDLELTPENFFNQLETGAIICRHANNVTQMGRNFLIQNSQQCQQTTTTLETNLDNLNENTTSSSSSRASNANTTSNSPSPTEPNLLNSTNNSKPSSPFVSLVGSLSSPKSSDHKASINWFRIKMIPFRQDAQPGTFFARDNICQFILWCRSLNVLDCLLFETDDLVARKNEKSFILCLLEVARIGFKVGMPTPLIIQLEQEIDREIENEAKLQKELEDKQNGDNDDDTVERASLLSDDAARLEISDQSDDQREKKDLSIDESKTEAIDNDKSKQDEEEEEEEDYGPKPQVVTNDLLSLHERVVQLLCQCTCPTQFPMVRVGDNGKYKVGDKLIIFVRILRRHIMVRVGGGWQELSEFLRVKDPCRSRLYQANHQHQHQYPQQHQAQQQLQQQQQQPAAGVRSLLPTSIVLSRSPLTESTHQLNKGLSQHFRHTGGQRLISGSASMSWISHNS